MDDWILLVSSFFLSVVKKIIDTPYVLFDSLQPNHFLLEPKYAYSRKTFVLAGTRTVLISNDVAGVGAVLLV